MLACGGCATGGRTNLWPIYFHENRLVSEGGKQKALSATEAIYPLFERRSDGETSWHAVRPLYNAQTGPGDRFQVQYLWPLGLYFRRGKMETHSRLFPLWGYHNAWRRSAGKKSLHVHLLQLIRFGRDARYGPYFAVFPLGGVTHNVIAQTWSFALFPLFSHYRAGDYARNDIIWPFLSYGASPDGRQTTYRFWPFYVHKRRDIKSGLYVRTDMLWPFVRWGLLDRGGNYYHTVHAYIPFYTSIKTWDRQERLVAASTSILTVNRAWDSREKKGRVGWSTLFSCVRKLNGPRFYEFRIFPFYWRTSRYATNEKDPQKCWTRWRVLWPLVWIDRDTRLPWVSKKGLVIAPFYWDHTRQIRAKGEPVRRGRSITFWPLATWERTPDGERHFWIPSHGWSDPGQGYKRNYRALLELFQYHHRSDGQRETRLLWRLYHHRRGPNGRYLSIMSLFTYDSTAEVVGEPGSYVSLLFGLIKKSWTKKRSRWRVFFIPIGPKLEGSPDE